MDGLIKIRDYFSYNDIALIEDSIEFELNNYLPGKEKTPRAKKLKQLLKKIEIILNEKESRLPQKQ